MYSRLCHQSDYAWIEPPLDVRDAATRQIDAVDMSPEKQQVNIKGLADASKGASIPMRAILDEPRLARLYAIMKKSTLSEPVAIWALASQQWALPRINAIDRRWSEVLRGAFTIVNSRSKATEKLRLINNLSDGWAGPDSVCPTKDVVAIALEFLRVLPTEVPSPEVAASSEGEIAFVWKWPVGSVEVNIDPDRFLAWLARFPPERESGAAIWNGSVPDALTAWLRQIQE